VKIAFLFFASKFSLALIGRTSTCLKPEHLNSPVQRPHSSAGGFGTGGGVVYGGSGGSSSFGASTAIAGSAIAGSVGLLISEEICDLNTFAKESKRSGKEKGSAVPKKGPATEYNKIEKKFERIRNK